MGTVSLTRSAITFNIGLYRLSCDGPSQAWGGVSADFAGGAGDTPRSCQAGKPKLTKGPRSPDRGRANFGRPSAWQGPVGSLREARKREPLPRPQVFRRLQVPTQDPEEPLFGSAASQCLDSEGGQSISAHRPQYTQDTRYWARRLGFGIDVKMTGIPSNGQQGC